MQPAVGDIVEDTPEKTPVIQPKTKSEYVIVEGNHRLLVWREL